MKEILDSTKKEHEENTLFDVTAEIAGFLRSVTDDDSLSDTEKLLKILDLAEKELKQIQSHLLGGGDE
ncbi:hypothetical protein [Caldalkalibacillus mannanilyticus]|uniref:hypothetical protein n=1 Tax=Caldalkalibacillus mannanilyticus TaxID=1418 RepID=UPI000468A590|nr:hypothetical protein [Caldalkalibacillus mannanilyticus]